MRAIAALLPIVLFHAASPAAAAGPARVIPCHPPLDRPLRLTVTQHIWLEDGGPATVIITRGLRFRQDAEGMVVEAHIAALDTDQKNKGGTVPSAKARVLLAYGKPGEVQVRVRLDTAMAISRVESLDELWQDFRARQARLDAAMRQGHRPNARTHAMLQALDAMAKEEKIAILTGFLGPLLRYCGTVAPAGSVASPDGGIAIESRVESSGISDIGRYGVDGQTGLLRTLTRSVQMVDAPLKPLREEWVLSPE